MSGFVVGYGSPSRQEIETMFAKIAHRGPYLSKMTQQQHTISAQNYLKADVGGTAQEQQIPVKSSQQPDCHIYYDGQIGNLPELARQVGEPQGPFWEERVMLALYQRHGPQMFRFLGDAIFALIIMDGENLLAARDSLGIKTLFYGRKEDTLYLASELKSLAAVTDNVVEFPAGHWMDEQGNTTRFAEAPSVFSVDAPQLDRMIGDIRQIITASVHNRIDFRDPTAGLLSGGLDSSVIGYVANQYYKEEVGDDARLPTFALGVGESRDIQNARIMADYLGTEHHELLVDLEQILEVLPEVIYYLESFDPSLVRSSASNFLISRYAKEQGIQVLLSGEGGDEIFCGYRYLHDVAPQELPEEQIACLNYLHNNASLRLDRMNQCHSIKVVAPLISGELLDYSLNHIPPNYKLKPEGNQKIEKWIFRKAFEDVLPEEITWRSKQEFSQGSGSADVLPQHFESLISDHELSEAQQQHPQIRSKEELAYFRIFTGHFGDTQAVETVGQWISL